MKKKKRGFLLTRHAALLLRDIHAHSLRQWGRKTAGEYIAELYAVMAKAAETPEIGRLRAHRAASFLMTPVGRHFIVYDHLETGIVILTFLHQRRDIERIIARMKPAFLAEILALREKSGVA